MALLDIENLTVEFDTAHGPFRAVDGVSFSVDESEVLAIVGESGSGKSVTAMTLMGLTRGPNAKFEGKAMFEGNELISASDGELRKIRGAGIAM
ncbi:MAG: ATP-binding cassette domain-containing protein, partial [Rhizobiaceae bacterium]